MLRHVIVWQLKDGFTDDEKAKIKADAKAALEALQGRVDGLKEIRVYTEPVGTSNCDMMLDSALDGIDALYAYRDHPLHVAAADKFIRPFVKSRNCFDFEV